MLTKHVITSFLQHFQLIIFASKKEIKTLEKRFVQFRDAPEQKKKIRQIIPRGQIIVI